MYLQALPPAARRLDFTISGFYAVRDDGERVPLPRLVSDFRGAESGALQRRLSSASLPPGLYRGLAIEVERATVLGDEGAAALLVPEEALTIEHEFNIVRKAATALFLSLDPVDLIDAGYRFTPTFLAAKPRRQLRSLLGFATNSEDNFVSVFNKHTMEVVDTIATGSGPKGIVLDERNGWAYVALAGDDAIEAIEVDTGRTLRRLQLNFGDAPLELALSEDGRMLVAANRGSNSASVIDATSFREQARIGLPSEPSGLVAGGTPARVFVLSSRSNSVSAIDVARGEITMTQILDATPVRGAISSDGNDLYVITRYSSDVLVLDAQSLVERGRIHVGSGASSIKVDTKTNLIYVGSRTAGISVLDPLSLLPIDRFRLKGHAELLAIDDDENCLFVLLADRGIIQKLDLVSKQLRATIELGRGGYALALMGAR